MRSQKMTFGLEKAPHRSLLYALGLTREEMKRPLIGVVNAANEVVPGHLHLGKIAEAVKAGIRMAGGTPMEFPAIAVCDGLAMNHEGMRFSLTSREVITDSIEIMATAHPFDALVFIPNCDKIVPGMLMAAAALNKPCLFLTAGSMVPYEAEEGCLSLNGTRKTKRFRSIKVQWQNEMLQTRLKTFTGWTAEIIQHEIDHCEGILI